MPRKTNKTRFGMSSDEAAPWYVAHTKPRQEEVARRNLLRQGYCVYLPQLTIRRGPHGRQKGGLTPLFPRYLFFQVRDAGQSISPVLSTHGVATIVRFGGVPAVLRPETLEDLRALEYRQSIEAEESALLRPGRQVFVRTGPLAGLEGLVAMVSTQRVVVLMQLLGTQTKVELKPDQLRLTA